MEVILPPKGYKDPHAWVSRSCVCCAKTFEVRRIYAERGRADFCSTECWRASQRKGLPKEATEGVCVVCGRRFGFRPSSVIGGKARRHCSMECRKRRAVIHCRTCGKEFEVKTSIRPNAAFCSIACRQRGRAMTGLERIVARALDSIGMEYRREEQVDRWSVDLFVPEWRLAIEVDSEFWHNDYNSEDRLVGAEQKAEAIRLRGWRLCRIRELAYRGTPPRFRPSVALAIICAALAGPSPSSESNG